MRKFYPTFIIIVISTILTHGQCKEIKDPFTGAKTKFGFVVLLGAMPSFGETFSLMTSDTSKNYVMLGLGVIPPAMVANTNIIGTDTTCQATLKLGDETFIVLKNLERFSYTPQFGYSGVYALPKSALPNIYKTGITIIRMEILTKDRKGNYDMKVTPRKMDKIRDIIRCLN